MGIPLFRFLGLYGAKGRNDKNDIFDKPLFMK